MRYAQILNGKVHWIFESDFSLAELYEKYYNAEQVKLVDISAIAAVQEHWNYSDGAFSEPQAASTPIETAEEKAELLAAQYDRQLQELKDSLMTAMLAGDTAVAEEIKAEYAELMSNYQMDLETIKHGKTV